MSRNPNARVRAAKQAREVRQWQAIADGEPQPRAKSIDEHCATKGCDHPRHGQHRHCWHHYNLLHVRPDQPSMTPAEIAAEVEWLLGTDSPDHIAARLGRTRDSLYRSLRRIGRRDLIDALAAETMRAAELMRESRMSQVFGPDPRKAHGKVA